jgi:hypothetical protein
MPHVTTASAEQGTMRTTSDLIFGLRVPKSSGLHHNSELFNDWFSRCRGTLHFTACRVLGGAEGADLAVQNCWLRASRNPPTFDREGAFRSWLLRILVTEALTLIQPAAPLDPNRCSVPRTPEAMK